MQESLRRPLSRDRQSQSSTENWFERRQRSSVTDSRGCDGPKGRVPSSFQHPGGSRSLRNDTGQKGATSEHTGKPSRQRSEPHNKRRINRKSSDTARGGYRSARPAQKSEERPSEVTKSCTFEVKLSDFPELSDAKPLANPDARPCWGSVKSSALHDSPAAIVKETSGNKGPKQKPIQHVASTEKIQQKSTAIAGEDIELVLPNPYGSPATSWASIASQPPKVRQKSPAARDASSQEDVCQPEAEQTVKKKRKKKKKSKPVCEDVEQETHNVLLIQQEPPKFEDEEEFPDLSFASVNPNKGQRHFSNPGIQENTGIPEKDGSVQQSENINKSKAADVKSGSAASKKVQPVGQKKSKALVQLDLGNMLAVLEQKQQSQKSRQDVKPLTLSVGGALPVVHKDPTAQKKHSWQQERIAHNPLDSTCPLVKKGKQREVPKAKKPTPLKRVILKEREERKQNRLLEERDPTRMTSEVSQEPQASENLSESSSAQQCLEPTSDQSGAEEADRTGSPEDLKTLAEENAPSKNWNSNSNPNHPKIHSRKFRDYCSQMLSKDVDECVTTLLKELVRFQDRLYQKDPMKARMKRRLVMGLREVLKHLKLRKVKCVIISPNCERVQSKGGLDEALHTIIDTCLEQGVPFVFALSRKALGRCVNKAVPVSLVGIFNYDGAQDHYHKMIELTSQARKDYEMMITNLEVSSQEQPGEESETQQHMEPPLDTLETEEPEYIKVWKKMLEKDYNHKFLPFEEQFASVTISTDSDNHLNDVGGS
ncbi:selenocysteine insertion sequence-binding protein 2 isoform X1 [Pangasianodon hypophthalmus]|uniref:selenocysteine insertion sequence-binding protein 2 isoform X1 n=1 Tax=Pangasianodon hypophthalmus TaxID=310915 RepID=UPI0023070F91|nr:selenocysteine insertion sequence-binding protein 2 isoform X1 [Pangasianodon hypophthalmus]XP_026787276.3 selenocysteine insertion sequence-binding protein 2 isoform X1 [Pangasianodon hypophthalmus]XP_026787277.3 selenocysteine insertion sequence-binding protein 2 isoform X1 [Pangasianodon hypophthalmus]